MGTVDVEALKASVDLVSVIGAYVELKKRGSELVGLCPYHADSNPSFWVVPQKGFAHCFSCGANKDAIEFVMDMESIPFKEACEKLGARAWTPKVPIAHEPAARLPDRVTSKPPQDAPEPNMAIRGLGLPSTTWTYRDPDGALLGYVARYNTSDGKQIRCWSWGTRGDVVGWGCGHWNKPRPLYQLEELADRPEDPVLIVEGEKAADSAQSFLAQYVVITWPGGANAWKHADFEPLRGRRVDLWPDNDTPGRDAMAGIIGIISDQRGLACHGKLVDPSDRPEGFDAADWSGTPAELLIWLREHAQEYTPKPPPVIEIAEPPPVEFPPEATPAAPPKRARPRLAAVDGNTALEPEPDAEPLPQAMSEDALADHFATQHGERWRYVKPWGSWFEWLGDGWHRDDTAKVDRLAVELTRQAIYWPEASKMSDDARRRINSKRTAGSVRDLALSDRRIAATIDQWDTDPWLLGIPGGVVDLRIGQAAPAKPDQFITKRTRVAPAHGDAPLWSAFLETVTAENAELIQFLQRLAGYALTGETREQCLAFLYGTGQNGKGVFITTLSNILGDYAVTADADVFMESDQARHSTEMARLRGARLVAVDETDGSKRWNEKRIKRITGGGKIEARFMRQDDFEFMPQFKLLIAGNHKPQLRGVGKAIQRRIHLVPFTVTIPDSERDDKLQHKLEAEYPQILQWMIDGCAVWLQDGLKPPLQVVEATSRYIEGEDVIGEWLEEKTEQRGETERPIAYKNYRAWVEGRGERPWSSKAFWAALEERGYTARKSNGLWRISGLSLRFTPSDEATPSWHNN